MEHERWHQNPLSYLISGVSTEEFFAKYHEQRALYCEHSERNRFEELLSVDRIDEIISTTELPPASVQMARKEPPIDRSFYTFKNGNIDRGAVINHYQNGATIILPQLNLADEKLAQFSSSLEKELSCKVQTNAYLTPTSSQGFSTHYDDHDVFIIQVSGKKKWRLYQKPIDNPYSGEKFKAGVYDPGALEQDFILKAGDCVYIPRGLMHDATNIGDEPSLHITVGLLVKKWADLMLEAMSEVALRNSKFRRSLPAGFAVDDFNDTDAKKYFHDLISDFSEEANFEEVFEYFKESFLRLRRPDYRNQLNLALSSLEKNQSFIRRTNMQALVRSDGNEVIVVAGGGDLHFISGSLKGLKIALSGKKFSIDAFSNISKKEAESIIRKLCAFGLIEKTDI
jgi:ribosomal protein L16 Arg81 hydroxylase